MKKLRSSIAALPVWARGLIVGLVAVLAAGLWFFVIRPGDDPEMMSLSEFRASVADGEVATATIGNRSNTITGELDDGRSFETSFPAEYSDELTAQLLEAGVDTTGDNEDPSVVETVLYDYLPTLLIIGVFVWFALQLQSGGRAGLSQAKARRQKDSPETTFADVAGIDEAVEELTEIKEFLEDPDRFRLLGAKIPRGVLLVGPPGTGKTLLARAVAGEAGVPFFTISGSDFVEMFVGVGAARVRDLFKQAKAAAPAIVFVDEIDAVGRHRGGGVGGGHDEREQTLNQMLVEMDGFDADAGVILMAATNRPDILDPALLRPGRFDRHVVVDAPDQVGRQAILEVHARNKPLASDVDLGLLARRTPGFTGADLANVINEAALMCGRRRGALIERGDVDEAVDRVIAGPERKSRVMGDHERRVTAYHEAGHALVGHALPHTDPIHKVSIVSRGRALGWTLSLPDEDRHTHTRRQLSARLAMLMGGRCAEELIFDEITTGAADDIEQATRLARAMVTEFGMSDAIGPQRLSPRDVDAFLGREPAVASEVSDAVAEVVDSEIAALLESSRDVAMGILRRHRDVLDSMADALSEHETLDADALAELFVDVEEWPDAEEDAP